MRFVRQVSFAALSVACWTLAFGQDQGDPYAELGLVEESVPVADQAVAPAAAAGLGEDEGRPLTEQTVLDEHARFVRLLDEQNYDAADVAAKRVIEMSIKLYGPQSHETAKALNNLAVVQNRSKQYDAAIQNFTSSIEILEVLEDRLNAQLINPLKGLGQAQLGSGRPDLARETYTRATHITHVNEGPHNIEQVEILESLAEASVRMGDVKSARDVLDRIHILNVRHFADDALALLPSLMRRADWQHRAGYYNDERATYRRAVRIVEDSVGKNDPLLVDPLIRLGRSFYFFEPLPQNQPRYVGSSTGEIYLKRANRIAENSENISWLERTAARLALADYYIYSESYSRARNIYENVWNELSDADEHIAMRSDLLERPNPIWVEALPPYTEGAASAPGNDRDIQTGVVTVEFSVSDKGRVDIKEVANDPAEFTDMQRVVARQIKRRIYRPMMVDGAPVDSGPQSFSHEYRYSQSELEKMRESAPLSEESAPEEE